MAVSTLMDQPGSTLEDELELTTHGRTVALISMRIAKTLGFDRESQRRLGLAGALHDVGKRLVDERVLAKPGPLDAHDWAQIKLHPGFGERILRHAGLDDIAVWVRWHHERPDGRGYPDGILSSQIPLEASILAVADAFDAMVTERCYGRQLNRDEARAELRRGAGTQFDPAVVSAALRCGLDVSSGADARFAIE